MPAPAPGSCVALAGNTRTPGDVNVTSTADNASAGALRQVIAEATAASSPRTIDVQLGSMPATITLTQGQLEPSNTGAAITIDGSGAGLLSISGNNANWVLLVDNGVTAMRSGLTITGGWQRRP
jgi:hypothetical protein